MKTLLLSSAATGAMLLATSAFAANVKNPMPEVTYQTGGVGTQSQERFEASENAYNLKIVSAYDTGHYLADTAMMITDSDGQIVVNTVSDGPFLMADLPAGTYTVSAKHGETVKRKEVRINENTNLREIVFHWPTPESFEPNKVQ